MTSLEYIAEPICSLIINSGFRDVLIRIHILPMRVASLDDFPSGKFTASPIASEVAALDGTARADFFNRIQRALGPYMDNEGFAIPFETHVTTARA